MRRLTLVLAFSAALVAPLSAQFAYPVPVIERRMRDDPLVVDSLRGSRMQVDRTQRVYLNYGEEGSMQVKWAKAPRDGGEFNNEPRYEIAAYELQKLFLDEADYVVPPTVGRAVPLDWFQQYDASASATFRGINSVVLAVQYWMTVPLSPNFWQEGLFQVDSLYARHLADFNILTYLMRHSDTNSGNYLVVVDAKNPRVFTVDNVMPSVGSTLAPGETMSIRLAATSTGGGNFTGELFIDTLRRVGHDAFKQAGNSARHETGHAAEATA